MSLRLTTQEIRKALSGGGPEPWMDLFEDFHFCDSRAEDVALMHQSARFLESEFPHQKWGWQDFDKVIAQRLIGRYSSREEVGRACARIDLGNGDVTDEMFSHLEQSPDEFIEYLKRRPSTRVLTADDAPGGFILFTGIRSIQDVSR